MHYDRASMDAIAKQISEGYHEQDHNHGSKMVNEAIDSMFELYQHKKQCQQSRWCDSLTGPALNQLSKELRKDGILKEGESIINWDPSHHNFMVYDSVTERMETMTSRDSQKRFDPRGQEPIRQLSDAERHQQAQEAARKHQEDTHKRQQQQLEADERKLQQTKEELAKQEQQLAERRRQLEQQHQRAQEAEQQRARQQQEERERPH
jgi:DNA repair exonuclease SbcCD ATPase subunit